ncbi:uncharacterized protein LOC130758901 isoform X2 [Actinidia eriantha]|uniref:uncharacterized protein LOC130758901 isoform X2 n=1 Tax=Actinidia eriantha TaxID=165200 RepID=UPI002584A63F|nr:uncharacterized protein LOC130758901 isoform X2 [Actinidia eriantha]
MDKSRGVRRGEANRFAPVKRQIIKQSGVDGNGGDYVFPEKLKRERMRKLSVVGKMGSDSGDEFRSTASISKRFKLPREFFHDSKRVDYASVPRKLRSAMKKPNRELISPPLPGKKRRKDGKKKSRPNEKQEDSEGSLGRRILGLITKDEEEVVQTLYALAEMFPNNDEKNSLDDETGKTKSWPLMAFEDTAASLKEEDSKSLRPSNTAKATSSSLLEVSPHDTVDVKCPNQPSIANDIHLHTELDDAFSHRNLQAMSMLAPTKPISGTPFCSSVGLSVQSEISMGNGSKRPKHEKTAACDRKPEIEAAAVNSQHELQYILKECKISGSALWPSTGSDVAGTQGPALQSSSPTIPAWLRITSSANPPGSLDNGALMDKITQDSKDSVARKKSWKRCSAHEYICRLIKILQIAEMADRSLPTQSAQLTPNEGSKQGVLFTTSNLNGVINDMNGALSVHSIIGSAADKKLIDGQQQASTTSALHTSLKQGFDFLSLSAGGSGIEAHNGVNKVGDGPEPWTQFHGPFPPSLPQNHAIMPFSLPPYPFSSASFTHHLPLAAVKQVQIQPPAYMGHPLLAPQHLGNSASPKQQHQQQQQWIWTAQQADQYKPVGFPASLVPKWQNGRQESASAIQYAQSIPQPSYSSLELLGPKYAPISQQELQLIAVTSSLPTARDKRQHPHNLFSGYEGNVVGSLPDAALPLQLLCNDHL